MLSTAQRKTVKNSKKTSPSFADTYHGKVLSLNHAEQLVTLDREICIENLEKIIPYSMAKDIILKNPDHIAVIQCPCRKSKQNPCEPLDVCLIIGEPFAGFVVEHHPDRSKWISQDEALKIIREEHKRGHVHHAFFKDAMLERFYAICNCCSCCCGAMHGHRNQIPMLASSGYTAKIDAQKCEVCHTCIQNCPFDAISEKSGKIMIDFNNCMGCGICVSKCPNNSIKLQSCPEKGEPLDIKQLIQSEINYVSESKLKKVSN